MNVYNIVVLNSEAKPSRYILTMKCNVSILGRRDGSINIRIPVVRIPDVRIPKITFNVPEVRVNVPKVSVGVEHQKAAHKPSY